jgi:hypothetical protein
VKTDQSVERGEKATSSDLGFAEALAGVGPEKAKKRREGKDRRSGGRGGKRRDIRPRTTENIRAVLSRVGEGWGLVGKETPTRVRRISPPASGSLAGSQRRRGFMNGGGSIQPGKTGSPREDNLHIGAVRWRQSCQEEVRVATEAGNGVTKGECRRAEIH